MQKLATATCIVLFAWVFSPAPVSADSQPASSENQVTDVFVDKGVRVEFTAASEADAEDKPGKLREAEVAELSFRISDVVTGTPISPLEPAVWVNLVKGETEREELSCKEKVGLYLQGTLGFQADLDLNKFYMLVMNNDHTISVVDPILGISGITQLYDMIVLKERAEDWVMGPAEQQLFVTMPKAGMVAVVDLANFAVIKNVEVGDKPVRIALQPDGRHLWVGLNGSDPQTNGVTVVDAHDHTVVAHIATGAGHHEIAFSDDSLLAYVTNSEEGTLSVIDTQALKKIKDIPVGKRPVAVSFSNLSRTAYVASETEGRIVVVEGAEHRPLKTIRTESGLSALRFTPDGRWGFALNAKNGVLYVLDASTGAVVHTLEVGGELHQVAFTDTYAYVRSLSAPEVYLVRLSELGREKTPGTAVIPMGTRPPGEYAFPSVADAISPTGEYYTVLAANPAEKIVYYYMEGMVAPMGTFPTYGRVPRAVRVVDRSLRETERGVYSTKLRIPKDGTYEVVFLIDSPWIYNCFSFEAAPHPLLQRQRQQASVQLDFAEPLEDITVGQKVSIRFSFHRGDVPLNGLEDVTIFIASPPGNRQRRQVATPLENGWYQATFTADRPGVYSAYFAVPSLGVDVDELPSRVFRVIPIPRSPERR